MNTLELADVPGTEAKAVLLSRFAFELDRIAGLQLTEAFADDLAEVNPCIAVMREFGRGYGAPTLVGFEELHGASDHADSLPAPRPYSNDVRGLA